MSQTSNPSPASSTTASGTDEAAFIQESLEAEAGAIHRLAERAGGSDLADWQAAVDMLQVCEGHVVVSGMGKSGLIGAKISATLSSLGQPSHFVHPAEAVHGDLGAIRRGDVVMLLSYSGETEEVVNLAALLRSDNVPRLGISMTDESTLARLCNTHIALGDITEACPLNLAPTASTTAMLAVGDALALAVSRRRNFDEKDYQRRHPGGMLGAGLRRITEALRFRVGENLPVVRDDATVGAALEQAASDRRAGAIVLVDANGKLSGIFTDGDFRRLMRNNPQGMTQPIKSVMTQHPKHLTTDCLVRDAVQIVRECRLDEIPVVDSAGQPVGLVDVQDLIAMKVVTE